MTKFIFKKQLLALVAMGIAFTSCQKDVPINPENLTKPGEYVVAATVDGTNYLLATETLDSGKISVKGRGLETETGTYWVFHQDKYLFRIVYNKGGDGTGSSYIMTPEKTLKEFKTYSYKRVTTYGSWKDNVITASTGDTDTKDASGNPAKGILFNYLSSTNGTVNTNSQICENFLGNGEYVHFAGFVEKNGNLYTSVVPGGMSQYGVKAFPDKITDTELITKQDGGSGSGSYKAGMIPSTQYPDSCFVAIYSGSDFSEKPTIVRTGKMGFSAGRMRSQYYQQIWAADNGDIYVFSSGIGRTYTSSNDLKKVTGTLPSAVMRIKKGETKFDDSFYVNLEETGPKLPVFRVWHIEGSNFLMQMYDENIQSKTTTKFAIFNADNSSVKLIEGMPEASLISNVGNTPYGDKGMCYLSIVTNDGRNPAFYRIDPKTATATRGLEVEAEAVSAGGKLLPMQ